MFSDFRLSLLKSPSEIIPVVAPDSISVALTTTDVSCFGSADGIASAIISTTKSAL